MGKDRHMIEDKLYTLHLLQNPIAYDYVHHFDKVGNFFSANYRDSATYKSLIKNILTKHHSERQRLVDILVDQNKHFSAGEATLRHLHLLGQEKTLTVVTGQQVGIFGGPLYTLYKALTTCKLAQHLSQFLQHPIVPVFFLVSEDHDFEEIRWTGYINKNHQFKKLFYAPSSRVARQPLSEMILDQNINRLIEELESDTFSSEFKSEIIEALRQAYQPGIGVHVAFARWYALLLRNFGIIFFDASDPRIKELALPIFRKELLENASIPIMLNANSQLSSLGYSPQLPVHPNRPHVFILDHGRHSLQREGQNFRSLYDHRIYSPQELLANPQLLSPKAALRPIVQNYLLPVLAYVAGPAEIAYWAQLKGVHQAFNIPMPVVVPRSAFTIIEKKVQRHMDQLGFTVEKLFCDKESFLQKAIYNAVPKPLLKSLEHIKNTLEQGWVKVRQNLPAVDPTLVTPAEKTEQQMLKALRQFESKLAMAVEQREQITLERVRVISETLFPENQLQERQLNITPLLFKYHWSVVNTIFEKIDVLNLQHQILIL